MRTVNERLHRPVQHNGRPLTLLAFHLPSRLNLLSTHPTPLLAEPLTLHLLGIELEALRCAHRQQHPCLRLRVKRHQAQAAQGQGRGEGRRKDG